MAGSRKVSRGVRVGRLEAEAGFRHPSVRILFSGMRLTLRVQRGLARLVLRHLVGRMLLALLAEALLSLGNVHLRRVEEGDGRQRRSRGENGATRGHLAKALKRQWKTPRSSPKRDARGRCDGRDAPETRRHGGIAHGRATHHLYRSPSLWRHVAARL